MDALTPTNTPEKQQQQPPSVCAQHFWDKVIGQDNVVRALTFALETGTLAHAYLFVGAQGLGKINAARAVATQLMCPEGGCGQCEICRRLERNEHPDFRILEPAGAGGYLIEQIRELNYEVHLAPAEAERKVFVVRDVDLFNASAANAFLKTLEEPTDTTVFILLAHTLEAVLPTIRSRCQIFRFRPLSPEHAAAVLLEKTGVSGERARVALAANGYIVSAARDFLASPKQQEARSVVLRAFRDLPTADDLDVLGLSRAVLASTLESVSEMRAQCEATLLERKELLDPVALKQLERYNERRLSAFELRSVAMVLNVLATLLADCLRVATGANGAAVTEGNDAGLGALPPQSGGDLINLDARDTIIQVSRRLTPAMLAQGQEAIGRARRRLTQNVNTELLTDALLFDLREVLR